MQTVEGFKLTSRDLSALTAGETLTFAARPSYATVGMGTRWDSTLLLLTDCRLLISKDRLVGKPKADFSADWSDVSGVRSQLWMGGGPQIQLHFQAGQTDIELILRAEHATDIESAIRAGYLDVNKGIFKNEALPALDNTYVLQLLRRATLDRKYDAVKELHEIYKRAAVPNELWNWWIRQIETLVDTGKHDVAALAVDFARKANVPPWGDLSNENYAALSSIQKKLGIESEFA